MSPVNPSAAVGAVGAARPPVGWGSENYGPLL